MRGARALGSCAGSEAAFKRKEKAMRQWRGRVGILIYVAIFSIWLGSIGFAVLRDLTAPYAVHMLTIDRKTQEVRVYQERYGIRVIKVQRDMEGRAWPAGYFLLKKESGSVMRGRYIVGRFVPLHIIWWPAPEDVGLYRLLGPQS